MNRFRFKFDCNDGLGLTGGSYGAAAGSSIRPDGKGRFRIRDKGPDFKLAIDGDLNRRFTKASGTLSFRGNMGDTTACDTGELTWRAVVQP